LIWAVAPNNNNNNNNNNDNNNNKLMYQNNNNNNKLMYQNSCITCDTTRKTWVWGEDNIKIDTMETGFGGVEWINLAQDRPGFGLL
jgi:hypothetical protein